MILANLHLKQHLIVQSKNGTGKTLAFSLLLLSNLHADLTVDQINDEIDDVSPLEVKALVIAPTREIAIQIQELLQVLTVNAMKPPALVIGGIDIKEQRRKLIVDRPTIIVGTPGRIKEMIDKEWISLASVNTVVVDEADKFCCSSAQQNQSGVKFFEDMASLINLARQSKEV